MSIRSRLARAAAFLGLRDVAPGKLILLRHGQSIWNLDNRFTGWANVDLSERGREEAIDAAEMLLEMDEIDVCYTSVLRRSTETASICLDAWVEAGRRRPEVAARWRLNERHYGALTGLNKREALGTMDPTDLRRWRASFEGRPPPMEVDHLHYSRTPPRYARLLDGADDAAAAAQELALDDVPLTESLADTRERVRPLWEHELQPSILAGKTLLVVGHANCLRALISCLQPELRDEHLPSLGLPNALPLVYEFDSTGGPIVGLPDRCYISPLHAHYLGDACVLFTEMDADGSGAIDAAEFDASEYCQVAFDDSPDAVAEGDDCGERLRAEADNNNDGVVDFNEYMNWWAKLPERRRGKGGGGSNPSRFTNTLN